MDDLLQVLVQPQASCVALAVSPLLQSLSLPLCGWLCSSLLGWKSELKVWAEMVSPEAPSPFLCVLIWSSLWVCLDSTLIRTQSYWMRTHPNELI
jgi:hypothetical protein